MKETHESLVAAEENLTETAKDVVRLQVSTSCNYALKLSRDKTFAVLRSGTPSVNRLIRGYFKQVL